MNRLLQRNKKADSVIIGYVLLIVLALGMAGAVYSYLKFYIPKERPSCPEGANLAVESSICNAAEGKFTITLVNKGLFDMDGAYIKIGNVSRSARTIINCPDLNDITVEKCQLYFNTGPPLWTIKTLKIGETWTREFVYDLGTGERALDIEPIYLYTNGTRIVCTDAIIHQKISCT